MGIQIIEENVNDKRLNNIKLFLKKNKNVVGKTRKKAKMYCYIHLSCQESKCCWLLSELRTQFLKVMIKFKLLNNLINLKETPRN